MGNSDTGTTYGDTVGRGAATSKTKGLEEVLPSQPALATNPADVLHADFQAPVAT